MNKPKKRVVVKPEQLRPDDVKSPASPTRQDEMIDILNKNHDLRMAKAREIEEFEKSIVKHSHNHQVQTLNQYAVDVNVDMTLDFATTNHDASVLLFTVPTGLVLYTKKLILACVDVVDVESLAYLNSITIFYAILGTTSYSVASRSGQVLPYYTLTPFSYFNGNPIADFEMEIPQNTPITIYGKYTDQFISDMTSAGITDIQYHFNIRLLGKLFTVQKG